MIRRIATLAALLLLTMMSAAMAHEHGMTRMDAPAPVAAKQTPIAAPAVEVVMTAAPVAACGGDACDTSHKTADTCSAICAIACLAVLGDHAVASPALAARTTNAAAPALILTPTADAPPTPPPRA
jgi:hypothetical protein